MSLPPAPPPYDSLPPQYANTKEKPARTETLTPSGLLSPSVLVLDRYTESFGHRYDISDSHGTRLGSIKPDVQWGRPSVAKFHYVVTNNSGTELMSFTRSRQLFSGSLRTEVSATSVVYDKITGVCKSTDRNGNGYSLYTSFSSTGVAIRDPFCTSQSTSDGSYHTEFVDDSGSTLATVVWRKDDVGTHASCKIRVLVDDSGHSALSTVTQRSVLLATAISIDFDSVADDQKS